MGWEDWGLLGLGDEADTELRRTGLCSRTRAWNTRTSFMHREEVVTSGGDPSAGTERCPGGSK